MNCCSLQGWVRRFVIGRLSDQEMKRSICGSWPCKQRVSTETQGQLIRLQHVHDRSQNETYNGRETRFARLAKPRSNLNPRRIGAAKTAEDPLPSEYRRSIFTGTPRYCHLWVASIQIHTGVQATGAVLSFLVNTV